MASKNINTRIIHKHDTEENWSKASFIPKQGELIIYDKDDTHNIERFKIGDGTTNVNDLPFRSIDGGYDVLTEILPETTLNFTSRNLTLTNCPPIEVGIKYIVTFYNPETETSENNEYELIGQSESSGSIYIGNETHTWGGIDTGEPFIIYTTSTNTTSIWISSSTTLPYTYNIKIKAFTPIKIDEKYLDIKNTNIVNGSAKGSLRTVGSTKEGSGYEIGDNAFAEGYNTSASGSCSHAEGKNTIASKEGSHAEGGYTTASGGASHAEGNSSNLFSSVVTATNPTNNDIITAWNSKKFSLAKGSGSHVEGRNNLALGNASHAEGNYTTASGNFSHAEGDDTIASGMRSHAEGNSTQASGSASHAEGSDTKASGDSSHAEGYYTTASSNYQHVQGKYNIADATTYADIIGNGSSDTERSNAATVDWHGNAWYAGDVYVGSTSGTNKDEGSKKLATEEYVDNHTVTVDSEMLDNSTNPVQNKIIKAYIDNIAISDIDSIRSNATNGQTAYEMLSGVETLLSNI